MYVGDCTAAAKMNNRDKLCRQKENSFCLFTHARPRRRHAARFEEEFLRDMRDLGCREPTVLTRVSEYMHVIVAYIQQIMDKGYAYEANGSVYFDTQAFRCAPVDSKDHFSS